MNALRYVLPTQFVMGTIPTATEYASGNLLSTEISVIYYLGVRKMPYLNSFIYYILI